MEKLFSYALATLLVASSTHAMNGTSQEKTTQQTSPQFTSKTYSETTLSFEISQKIIDMRNTIEINVVQALGLPNNESLKVYQEVYNDIDNIGKLAFNYKKINKNADPQDEKKRFIYKKFKEVILCMEDDLILMLFHPFDYLRNDLVSSAQKEIDKYNYQKEIATESYQNKGKVQKAWHYMYNLTVNVSDQISNELETTKFNAHWYETEGCNLDLNNSKFDKNLCSYIKFSQDCSNFLKQENIQ